MASAVPHTRYMRSGAAAAAAAAAEAFATLNLSPTESQSAAAQAAAAAASVAATAATAAAATAAAVDSEAVAALGMLACSSSKGCEFSDADYLPQEANKSGSFSSLDDFDRYGYDAQQKDQSYPYRSQAKNTGETHVPAASAGPPPPSSFTAAPVAAKVSSRKPSSIRNSSSNYQPSFNCKPTQSVMEAASVLSGSDRPHIATAFRVPLQSFCEGDSAQVQGRKLVASFKTVSKHLSLPASVMIAVRRKVAGMEDDELADYMGFSYGCLCGWYDEDDKDSLNDAVADMIEGMVEVDATDDPMQGVE